MFIEIDQQRDVCILRCAGRLVAAPDIVYMEIKIDEIKKLECKLMVADFSEVISIGSLGVAFLAAVYTTTIQRPGGRFVLTGANALLQRVLDLTHLDRMIPQACDLTSGLAILRAEVSASSRSR
jgi:anti-anti-sigma factor